MLDLNCFSIFVNLHFAISAIFISLSSPYGRYAPLKDDPIILQLIGVTDEHLIRLVAAAYIIQFLLTYSPATQSLDCKFDEQYVDNIAYLLYHDSFCCNL